MKILILNTIEYSINGIASVILSHVKSLSKVNQLSVTCWGNTDSKYEIEFSRMNVITCSVASRKEELLKYRKQLKNLLKSNPFDIIHIHGNSGTMAIETRLAKKYSKARVIVHLHNSTCSHPVLYGPNSLLTYIMKRNADCLVACSRLAGDWLYKKNYVVLPNAIDINKFAFNEVARKDIRKKYGIEDDTFVIGHVGLFNEQKNQAFLVKVFSEYLKINTDARLMLVGDGMLKADIERLCVELGVSDKVIFAGVQHDMPAYYSSFDMFVFPSCWEGLGIVNIEAQASGLPVFASDAVPEEVALSDNVVFMDLQSGAVAWAEQVENMRKACKARYAPIDEMKKQGYDLAEQSDKLAEIYKI